MDMTFYCYMPQQKCLLLAPYKLTVPKLVTGFSWCSQERSSTIMRMMSSDEQKCQYCLWQQVTTTLSMTIEQNNILQVIMLPPTAYKLIVINKIWPNFLWQTILWQVVPHVAPAWQAAVVTTSQHMPATSDMTVTTNKQQASPTWLHVKWNLSHLHCWLWLWLWSHLHCWLWLWLWSHLHCWLWTMITPPTY
jgi:hypothetical protein